MKLRLAITLLIVLTPATATAAAKDLEFFESKIRPVLVEHCYKCHSADSKELKGGLRLDLKAGWQAGGDSGEPAIVPGKPGDSPLIAAVRHAEGAEAMPPNQSKLPESLIADLTTWVKNGAVDPREGKLTARPKPADWETIYQQRLQWWSLQPIKSVAVPATGDGPWPRNEVDRFILRNLRAKSLRPAPEADRRILARRLSFVLTGLPPSAAAVERFSADDSPGAYDAYVQSLLSSPHFGEHWARHWMDVVHYSDTHGYEWDTPAKNAWMYRDYLIRAFNADIPFNRLILEQLAGDLIEARIDAKTQVNEALIAPMALRLGERRHGDNAQAEGVTQETMANIIDTVSKGFLGTTVACARCHDHKLDAIGQRDYYALAGVFMSTRWNARTVDAREPNTAVLAELADIKRQIRIELGRVWLADRDQLLKRLRAIPASEKAATFPQTLIEFWQREETKPLSQGEFAAERERRTAANRANLKLLADFTTKDGAQGWQWDGSGMQHGLARDGDIVIAGDGNEIISQVLPAGRWSHLWSPRLAGALRSPQFPPQTTTTLSVGFAGGQYAAQSMIVDQAFHCERMKFLNQPKVGWLTVTAGNFDSLEGSIDRARRRVYLELVTKSLNNYFPPRTGYGGVSEKDAADGRSWFGVTKIFEHPAGNPPVDELARFGPLYQDSAPADADTRRQRFVDLLQAAAGRWSRDECTADDALLLDEALRGKLLSNELTADSELAKLVAAYRAEEKKLQPDQTIGSVSEWHEGGDERIGVRGSYTEFGDEVPRGGIRFLSHLADAQPAVRNTAPSTTDASSGRLQLARVIASEQNPLTARVYVNRVWQHLFGQGLVETPDDFGHLGQQPTHPELLDYLAERFMREGWSTKKLITLLVSSATWRQSSQANQQALAIDPENRFWHHLPMRRLEAESIRDSILVASGRFDGTLFGPPIDPFRTAEDPMKRLLKGPLDGRGRRSIYTKMTLMEPPRFLALFNQPIPLLTVGKRDVTNVPDQALALLNDPFVLAMAQHWSERVVNGGSMSPEQRAAAMFGAALSRPATEAEVDRLVRLARRSGELRQVNADSLLTSRAVWQDVGHAIFNLKEFIYVQ